jgi:hypothetical protein
LDYLTEIRTSKFVLCPRGLGTSSNRLYEVMQLGRVPVILADDWDPPRDLPWAEFSIRVAESDVPELRNILEPSESRAAAMGARAAAVWRESCEPGAVLLDTLLTTVDEIRKARPVGWNESLVHDRWKSPSFLWVNGIHPAQAAYDAFRKRDLGARVRRKVSKAIGEVVRGRSSDRGPR